MLVLREGQGRGSEERSMYGMAVLAVQRYRREGSRLEE
jgi:hypothetical protein